MPDKLIIEELLVKYYYLMQNQLDRAMHFRGQDMGQSVEEPLMDLGYVIEEAVTQCAALRDHIPVVNPDDIRIDLKAVDMVSPALAERNRIIPIDFNGDRLVVTATCPMDQNIPDEIATITGMEVKVMLVTSCAMGKAIEETYGSSRERFDDSGEVTGISSLDRQNRLLFMERVESAPVVRMVNAIIGNAYSRSVSDTRVEPSEHDLVIRTRINGDLIVHTTLEMEYHRPMVTRLRLMAGIDVAGKRLPQDGKYHYGKASVSTDLGTSTLPIISGEKVALGLLGNDRGNSLMDIKRLDMNEEQREVFERILKVLREIVLATGSTGSGKTTTFYVVLSRVAKKKINMVTMEDPVEKMIEGITQMQINPESDLTLVTALCSILRQDPDAIIVGKIRSGETVSIGVRAAITGHLMFFTLHTNDCASTISRPRSVGAPPYMVAAALSGIMSQCLVKLLRPERRKPYVLDEGEKRSFGKTGLEEPESLFRAVGCPCCGGMGYTRRKAVYELVEADREVKSMVLGDTLPRDIRLYQRKREPKSIKEYVLQMVLEGEISMEKAEKVIYSMEQNICYTKRKEES